jgi:hypothetical protein
VVFFTIAAAITAAVVITMVAVITIIVVTAKLCLRSKSVTLLPIIYILMIKIVCLVIYTSFVFLKELLKGCVVNA